MDIASLVSSLPTMIGMLPMILQATQVMFFLFFIWFFGQISMRGYKAQKPFMLGMAGTLLAGSLCLVGGAAFAGFVPFLGDGILGVLQLDMVVSGLVVSIFLMIALHLITHKNSAAKPEELVEIMSRKVMLLEEKLKSKAHHIPEAEARKIAEGVMKGYKSVAAKIVGNEYEVTLRKEKKEGKVLIDIWDGEVKGVARSESSIALLLKDPHRVAGLAMIIALVIASAVFFEGFPNPNEDMASMFGLSMDDISSMASSLSGNPLVQQEAPDGCLSPVVLANYYEDFQDRDFVLDHVLNDEAIQRIFEENCGPVQIMLRINHEGQDLTIAFTTDGKFSYMTDNVFCMCVDTSNMMA